MREIKTAPRETEREQRVGPIVDFKTLSKDSSRRKEGGRERENIYTIVSNYVVQEKGQRNNITYKVVAAGRERKNEI